MTIDLPFVSLGSVVLQSTRTAGTEKNNYKGHHCYHSREEEKEKLAVATIQGQTTLLTAFKMPFRFLVIALASVPLVGSQIEHNVPSFLTSGADKDRTLRLPTTVEESEIEPLIVDGVVAEEGQFPYYVRRESYSLGTCGASLIYPDIVLTAAHCHGAFQDGVAVGYHSPENPGYYREVTAHRRHPGYNFYNRIISHDVLILKLRSPVTEVAPVALNNDPTVPFAFEKLTTCGTGRVEHEGDLSETLLTTDMYAVPNDICIKALGVTTNIAIRDDVLCAGLVVDNESTCNGDSGGPLVRITETGEPLQVGIVSFGRRCGSFAPNGFARVSTFYGWIQQQICELSESPPTDCPPPTTPDPAAVLVTVEIVYPEDPYETTFSVRDKSNSQILYAGPQDNPQRFDVSQYEMHLLPGAYRFEIYDGGDDGLTSFSGNDGSYTIRARVDDNEIVLVEPRSEDFGRYEYTDFVLPDKESVSQMPSDMPSDIPSDVPSDMPSDIPSDVPSDMPSSTPTTVPTQESNTSSLANTKSAKVYHEQESNFENSESKKSSTASTGTRAAVGRIGWVFLLTLCL